MNDISVNIPDGPSGTPIPNFGIPFSLNTKDFNPLPDGFPESLLDLLNQLQLLIPPGALKAPLNPNFGKDVFDAIMKLLDQFMPFLMLYKFFLPILNLIICIIEVLCALKNPFKLIRALKRLFRTCIPEFLNLFPIFALIIMIISLLLLILALIEYIIAQIIKFIENLLRNILALYKAMSEANGPSILAIARKIGSLLCIFQNFFVLFAIFNIIIQIIRDMLSLIFAIPPCDEGDPSDQDNCCTPDVCPQIVKADYTRTTGKFQYFNQVIVERAEVSFLPAFSRSVRNEIWQLYDLDQEVAQKFRNIFDAYDVPFSPKPIFFPTDATYTAQTWPKQAPYLINLRLFYNPANWGRAGNPRFIRFNKCIVTHIPTTSLVRGDLSTTDIPNGVMYLAGGQGFEDDNKTMLYGFDLDGKTPLDPKNVGSSATLENFIHQPSLNLENPQLSVDDGYTFSDVTYTFSPNIEPLLSRDIVTLGCVPDLAIDRKFLSEITAGDIGIKTVALQNLLSDPSFPNLNNTQQCLSTAISSLRADLTPEGVAQFQTTANLCLGDLKDKVNSALGKMVGIGVDPCKSSLTAEPKKQFTSKPITVTVSLNERNGLSLTSGLSDTVVQDIASRLTPHITFGEISPFSYNQNQTFSAQLTSSDPGKGTVLVSFDNNTLCTNILPTDINQPPVHTLQEVEYQFIYAPGSTGAGALGVPSTSTGTGGEDQTGQPRRDDTDLTQNDGGKEES